MSQAKDTLLGLVALPHFNPAEHHAIATPHLNKAPRLLISHAALNTAALFQTLIAPLVFQPATRT